MMVPDLWHATPPVVQGRDGPATRSGCAVSFPQASAVADLAAFKIRVSHFGLVCTSPPCDLCQRASRPNCTDGISFKRSRLCDPSILDDFSMLRSSIAGSSFTRLSDADAMRCFFCSITALQLLDHQMFLVTNCPVRHGSGVEPWVIESLILSLCLAIRCVPGLFGDCCSM